MLPEDQLFRVQMITSSTLDHNLYKLTVGLPAQPQGPLLELGEALQEALYEDIRILGCALISCTHMAVMSHDNECEGSLLYRVWGQAVRSSPAQNAV